MDLSAGDLIGVYTCELQLADGATLPAGVVTVHNGRGEWSHTVRISVSQLQRAALVTSTGVTVSSATFS